MRYQRSVAEKRAVDGIVFDSIAEAEAYCGFKAMQKAGKIRKLQYHTMFYFEVNGVQVGDYEADFTYIDAKTDQVHVIDIKGWKHTKSGKLKPRIEDGFRIRANLVKALYGIQVEVL